MTKRKTKAPEIKKIEPEAPKPKKFPFCIAPGKSLTTKVGILGPGEEIKAEHIAGGMEVIEKFIESGHIVKAH